MSKFIPYRFAVVTHLHAVQEHIRKFFAYDPRYTLDFFNIGYASPEEDIRLLLQQGYEIILVYSTFGSSLLSAIGKSLVIIPRADIDVIKVLLKAREISSSIVFSLSSEDNVDVAFIEELLDIQLHVLPYSTIEELQQQLYVALRQETTKVLVGGGLSHVIAEQYGTPFYPIIPNAHSIQHALEQAKGLAKAQREEKEISTNLMSLLRLFPEGVLCVNQDGDLMFSNDTVTRLLKLRKNTPDKDLLRACCQQLLIDDVLEDGAPRLDHIVVFDNKHLVVTTLPITFSPWLRGAVAFINDGSNVESVSGKLREVQQYGGFATSYTLDDIIGHTTPIQELKQRIVAFAPTDSPVCILGETGTGKEMVAQAIHNESLRRHSPFVAVNCAALPDQLLESELFGYEDGAFTGARRGGKKGYFELAHTGTLFLDEIGDMGKNAQLRLLRVLESKMLVKLGGTSSIRLDVRVISASNKNLAELVRVGEFRNDLFYRLMVLRLVVSPLRERLDDIPLLVTCHLQAHGMSEDVIAPSMHKALQSYCWPGNVRELYAFLDSYLALLGGEMASLALFEDLFEEWKCQGETLGLDALCNEQVQDLTLENQLQQVKKQIVANTLRACGNNRYEAARRLRISYTTLWRILTNK